MQALANKVIVKEDKMPEKIGNIFLPYQGSKPQTLSLSFTGTIVSVGYKIDGELKPGTRILFSRYSPMQVIDNFLVMTGDDVQAIIED